MTRTINLDIPETAKARLALLEERLHPESLRTLEQLVKLHGAASLIRAIKQIEDNLTKAPR